MLTVPLSLLAAILCVALCVCPLPVLCPVGWRCWCCCCWCCCWCVLLLCSCSRCLLDAVLEVSFWCANRLRCLLSCLPLWSPHHEGCAGLASGWCQDPRHAQRRGKKRRIKWKRMKTILINSAAVAQAQRDRQSERKGKTEQGKEREKATSVEERKNKEREERRMNESMNQ